MHRFVHRTLVGIALLLLSGAAPWHVQAGGSGLNVVVVVNQNSTNSCELGNYFCERRQVPPDNLLRINWSGGNIAWSSTDFQSILLTPLLDMLAARQLTTQIDYVVLSMDIPFQTVYGTKVNSTTSALFYGLQDDTGTNWMNVTNSYCASEQVFACARPASAPGYSFLTVMITADTLAQAKAMVDQGVASDGSFPTQAVVLAKSSDPARNVRYRAFDNAIFNTLLRGNYAMVRTNSDSPAGVSGLLGYETGLAGYTVSPNTFVPGAMADSMTSYGGIIFGPNPQTSLLAFIAAGAAGSYGTVTEPGSGTQKFPDPQNYFCQARGFSLAECYYQSVYAPYQGLVVGEPLAAPFAQSASGEWTGLASNAVLSGTVQLGATFSAPDASHPLQQVDLFVDGKYFQTLTNIAPAPGSVLSVSLNGYPVSYTVPANATLPAIAAGLAAQINSPACTNLTKAVAYAHGDRVELHSLATNSAALPFYFTDSSAGDGATRYYRTAFPAGALTPQLTSLGYDSDGTFRLRVEASGTLPYIVQATGNFITWVSIFTNQAGGSADFIDPQPTASSQRFYRTLVSSPPLPAATVVSSSGAGTLVRIDGAAQPYVLMASADQAQWVPVFTNSPAGTVPACPPQCGYGGQVVAGSPIGSADALSCFLSASQPAFLDSPAFGLRCFNLGGSLALGSWVQLNIATTHGAGISVTVTNQGDGATLYALAQQLAAAVNASPALQGNDGLTMEDLNAGMFGTASFNLRARSPGWPAAAITVQLTASPGVTLSPSAAVCLDSNQSDLQPRAHLYVTAGASQLAATALLDTTQLADGFHELTAVAYEGSDVHTQTPITLPVQVQNSWLSATLTLLDLDSTAPVQGTYHVQVTANTDTVSAISLYSTGGLLGTVSSQSTVTFAFEGLSLGAGLHPFYALVQTAGGQQYRTATQWVRLVNP